MISSSMLLTILSCCLVQVCDFFFVLFDEVEQTSDSNVLTARVRQPNEIKNASIKKHLNTQKCMLALLVVGSRRADKLLVMKMKKKTY